MVCLDIGRATVGTLVDLATNHLRSQPCVELRASSKGILCIGPKPRSRSSTSSSLLKMKSWSGCYPTPSSRKNYISCNIIVNGLENHLVGNVSGESLCLTHRSHWNLNSYRFRNGVRSGRYSRERECTATSSPSTLCSRF